MADRTRTKPYKRWAGITHTPTQLLRKVWGLGRAPKHIDLTLITSDLTLMDMDAPEIIPIGGTWREEKEFDDAIYQAPRVAYAPREGKPWRNPLLIARDRRSPC